MPADAAEAAADQHRPAQAHRAGARRQRNKARHETTLRTQGDDRFRISAGEFVVQLRIRRASGHVDAAAAQLGTLHRQGGCQASENRGRRIADRRGGAPGDKGDRLRGDKVLANQGQGLGQIGAAGRYREDPRALAETGGRGGGLPLQRGNSGRQTVAQAAHLHLPDVGDSSAPVLHH